MDDHLSKPFSMLTLQNMLDKWMQPKAAAAEAPTPAPRTPAPKKGEVIDRLVLEQLGKVLTNGKPELLTRVINLYLVESPKLVLKLKQAAAASNAPDMASAAHSLKSSSANVGAKALSRHCEELETLARRGETDEARRMLAKLEKEHRSVQRALTEESESLGARV
jgi:HPt (histidine-containing phosphotransfer) domain-containing protein